MQQSTESDDTRCCVNTIFPPEDGHVNARNMSRIIVTYILLINKEFALKFVNEIIPYKTYFIDSFRIILLSLNAIEMWH